METTNTQATKQATPEQMLSVKLNSESVKKKFEEMGNSLQFAKEVAFAIQSVQKNDLLMQCNPMTVVASLLNVSLTGITLNPILQYAYLIPRRNKGVMECTLDVSFKGLIQILTESGGVKNVYAHTVHEQDKFSIEYGLEPRLIHVPNTSGAKGKVIGVYGVAVLSDGSKVFDYMDIDEINYIMGRSEAGKKGFGPWKTDFNEMAKKTIIKRMFKTLPKNDKLMRVAEAIAIDNDNNGIDFEAESKSLEAKSKDERVAKGIQDAIHKSTKPKEEKKTRPKKSDKVVEEEVVPMSEEEIIEHIGEMQDVENLNAFIQSLETDDLTNKVFEAANKRDEELRNR